MIEGYDGDDIYIMVEDEFHSTAQTFTQYLHHAEYQRLKKKARDAVPPTFQPTDRMSAETRKKMESRALHAKQKDAVGSIANGVNLSGEEDEEQDDPWLGTSLAGLMTDASRQKRTALVGLEKIQSGTRAAKGFGRGTGDSPANRNEKMSVFDIFTADRNGKEGDVNEQDIESSGNDLGAPLMAKATMSRFVPPGNSRSREAETKRGPASRPASNLISTSDAPPSMRSVAHPVSRPRFREPSVAARKLFDDFDNFETMEQVSSHGKKSGPSSTGKKKRPKEIKERKMQMNDIPTFLV